VFQGPVVRCAVRAPDATEIIAHLGAAPATLQPGQTVFVDWEPDAPRLLPPTAAGEGAA
jgi:spermidine/putrescine transport system ATP-binding protein